MNIDFYKKRAERVPHLAPRFHAGIGMIQLHLKSKDERLHIWHHSQRATRPDSAMHNHKFSFRSYVLAGMLVNQIIVPMSGSDYNLWTTFCDGQEPSKLVGTVAISETERHGYSSGMSYCMEAGRFHYSEVYETTVTKMVKIWNNPNQPVQVIAKKGMNLDHAFSNDLPRPSVEKMWELIDDACSDLEVG